MSHIEPHEYCESCGECILCGECRCKGEQDMSNAVMVDIETMSTDVDAAIVAIGACAFDLHDPDQDWDNAPRFSTSVSLKSNPQHGRHIDPDTVDFWMKQSKEAQASLYREPVRNLPQALVSFRMWVEELRPRPVKIWACDADFDVVILRQAFKSVRDIFPFKFWDSMNVRTMRNIVWPDKENRPDFSDGLVLHDAADDCVRQAKEMVAAYQILYHGLKNVPE